MNPFAHVRALVIGIIDDLGKQGALPEELDLTRVTVEPPRDPAFGDMSSNAAMVLAKPARMAPFAIAEKLAEKLAENDQILEASVAKPGFVNIRLETAFWQDRLVDVLAQAQSYGRNNLGQGRPLNVEFCSANPTGRLHVGHCRGTVFGDALANLMAFSGYDVLREYYVNDGGAQIKQFARSIHFRYREIVLGDQGELPQGLYPSKDLIAIAQKLLDEDGDQWVEAHEDAWMERFSLVGVDAMLGLIREDLAAVGVFYDRFSSERELIEQGAIETAIDHLKERGLIYRGTLPPPKGKPVDDWEPVELLLFKSTEFGDDVDRPLQSSNGVWTYMAADIAYHFDKIHRGTPTMINVWGADHGGYVKRMQAAVKAHGSDASLDIRLCQLVNLMDHGKPLKMSKRAGRITNLIDVVNEVGKDVVRFMMLFRKNDAPLDFDLHKVTETSRENPVFYVQYAHARICSVLRNAESEGFTLDDDAMKSANRHLLGDEAELQLIRRMATFPRIVESAAVQLEPHRIGFYLHELAGDFHSLWNRGKDHTELRFLMADNADLTMARLSMLHATRQVLRNGMAILGVDPVEVLSG